MTINALNPDALAVFWAGLVGGTVRDAGNGFVLVKPEERGVRLLFQQADQPSAALGWIHLDCAATDRAAAEKEICQRGGRTIQHRSDSKGSWIVMADPEGNPFCIQPGVADPLPEPALGVAFGFSNCSSARRNSARTPA